ncbi:GntR family transcriptional regulator [Duganella sp. P38]|uniref:GntR family transcriptional regulator n=1 Tax=Duganella sp. P38 TaxID=3423949 RepID=UPI003D7BEE76
MKAAPASDSPTTDIAVDRKALLYDTLRRRITGMELAPGAVIDEVSLAEEFGLSRPPVRELMRQLAAEGYIELEPNRPARVAAMGYQSMRSFFLAAPLIYVATTQLAAQHATPQEVAELKHIQAQFRTAIEQNDVAARVHFNDRFHHAIGTMAHNDYLMPSLRRLLIDHARMGKIFYRQPTSSDMQANLDTAMRQHDEIIDAIERRDPQLAGELVRAHWELSRLRMTEYVVPTGMVLPIDGD